MSSVWFAMVLALSPSAVAHDLISEMGESVELDAGGRADLGGLVLEADDADSNLRLELWIASTELPDDVDPSLVTRFARIERALHDPEIGGRFEAGGDIIWDQEREAFYLVTEISTADTTRDAVYARVARFLGLGVMWREVWFVRVCEIVYGTRQPPAEPVTLPGDLLGGVPPSQPVGDPSGLR